MVALVSARREGVYIIYSRLSLTAQRWVRYQFKSPYRDGTTHLVLEPLDSIARLAAQSWRGKLSVRSISSANGAISSEAKLITVSRSMATVSPRSKLRLGIIGGGALLVVLCGPI